MSAIGAAPTSEVAPLGLNGELAGMFVSALVDAGAEKRSAEILVELRGVSGGDPKSLRGVSRGLSAERIRQLVHDVEAHTLRKVLKEPDAAIADIRSRVADLLVVIGRHAPGADETVRAAMAAQGFDIASPAGVVRLADMLGCSHPLRLTTWTTRAKYSDPENKVLAAYEDEPKRASVCAIVPDDMPEVFESFINFARKYSRGAGVVAAGQLAESFSENRHMAVSQAEAVAFLAPFAVHLGRHDGDEWFALFNSANDFLRKVHTRVSLFGDCSFEQLCEFHRRYNRSLYTGDEATNPASVLRAAIECAGYSIEGDKVTKAAGVQATSGAGRGATQLQLRMVEIFRETLAASGRRKSLSRAAFFAALVQAGVRESTAHIYMSNQGLFVSKAGVVTLANADVTTADDDDKPGVPRRARRLAGKAPAPTA